MINTRHGTSVDCGQRYEPTVSNVYLWLFVSSAHYSTRYTLPTICYSIRCKHYSTGTNSNFVNGLYNNFTCRKHQYGISSSENQSLSVLAMRPDPFSHETVLTQL